MSKGAVYWMVDAGPSVTLVIMYVCVHPIPEKKKSHVHDVLIPELNTDDSESLHGRSG